MLNTLMSALFSPAQRASVVEAAPAAAPAVWNLEPAHTHISFSVRHLGLTHTPGIFKRFSSQLDFDEQHIEASSVSVEIDVASLDTAFDLRDEHLRGADWFDVQTHPKITFASTAVRHLGERRYVIDGNLTVRGITLPVSFDTTLIDRTVHPWTNGPVIGFEAQGSVSRAAYGMGAFPHALSDEVQLKIALEVMPKA